MTVAVLDADSSLTIPLIIGQANAARAKRPQDIYRNFSVYILYVVHIYLGIIWPMLDEKLFMPSPCV